MSHIVPQARGPAARPPGGSCGGLRHAEPPSNWPRCQRFASIRASSVLGRGAPGVGRPAPPVGGARPRRAESDFAGRLLGSLAKVPDGEIDAVLEALPGFLPPDLGDQILELVVQ